MSNNRLLELLVMVIIERRRNPELLADQPPMQIVLNAGRICVRRFVSEIAGEVCVANALRS
jgi:hypothetical protein